MKMNFVFSILLCCAIKSFVNAALSSEEAAELTEMCCEHGEKIAMSGSSSAECGTAKPPDDLEPDQEEHCRTAVKSCCRKHYKQKTDCEGGMKYAAAKRCSVPKSDIGKMCCEECSVGQLTGESGRGKDSCGDPADEYVSPMSALRKNAYYLCCMVAAEKPETTTEKKVETTTEKKIETTTKKRETCKEKNPCEHICNDKEGKVVCQCKDGFRLQTDGKSCKDINECAEYLEDLCTEDGTVCHNLPGSFKCVPIRKRDVSLSCPPGFKRNVQNQVCDDINECQLPRPPCPKYLCENTIGAYKCAGKPGKPMTEVEPSRRGPTTEVAVSTRPKTDMCPPGFRDGPDGDCLDIDECEERVDDCQRLSQHCINTHGSFFCQDHVSRRCAPGFVVNRQTGVCEDINECEETPEACHRSEVCINLPGAYDCKSKISTLPKLGQQKCQEGTRMRPGGTICEDIDECREGTHLCDQFQNCINTYGGHECRCKNGFELDSASSSCVDIDECARNIDNCGPGLHCLNVLGTFTCTRQAPSSSTTHSPDDYEYYYTDEEDEETNNEPRPTPPSPPINPKPNPRPLGNYHPSPAPVLTTTPRPTTTSSTTTSTTTTPKPTTTSTTTTPKPTTTSSTTTPNPRTNKPFPERTNMVPLPLPPFSDQPPTGPPRRPNRPTQPRRPEDTFENPDRTTEMSPPPPPPFPDQPPTDPSRRRPYRPTQPRRPDATFENTDRTTEMSPPPPPPFPDQPPTDPPRRRPYNPNQPRRPEDTLENPDRNSRRRPYRPREESYPRRPDFSEVTVPAPENPDIVEKEKDANGTYSVDTGEIPKDRWTNVIGTESEPDPDFDINNLHCLNGYEKNSKGECVDSDECASGRYICSNMEVCKNQPGGYSCDCMAGFERDSSGWCGVVTTPTTSRSTTSLATTERTTAVTPTNPAWYYPSPAASWSRNNQPTSSCELGYEFDSNVRRCVDINECTTGKANCALEEDCVNREGGYRCQCNSRCRSASFRPNYVPRPDAPTVTGSNVVTVGSQYGQRGPRYMRPSYSRLPESGEITISCPWGYKLVDGKRCVDIDECAQNTSQCGSEQTCQNFYGGYSCQCPPGHKLGSQNKCEDIDECSYGNTCSILAKCVNTVGSYRCDCSAGFRNAPSNDKVCVDVDECAEQAGLCQQGCVNAWGGYRCTCNKGYELGSDNSTCMDIDECAQAVTRLRRGRLCVGECVNTDGSYRCSCPSGYKTSEDGRSCIDIDECENGEATCANGVDPSAVCQNTRGHYHCHNIDCPPGYRLESKHICKRNQQYCSINDRACLSRPSTYSYNFISFVSNIYLPGGSVDLFTVHGPQLADSILNFELGMVSVDAPHDVQPARISCFDMRPSARQCTISLLCSLAGPQVAELELTMSVYQRDQYIGNMVAKIIVIVSQYNF